jgi:hypothetical protein
MKTADRSDARIALVLGDRDGVAGVKDLATGEQRSVPLRTVLSASFGTRSLRRLLAKAVPASIGTDCRGRYRPRSRITLAEVMAPAMRHRYCPVPNEPDRVTDINLDVVADAVDASGSDGSRTWVSEWGAVSRSGSRGPGFVEPGSRIAQTIE